MTDTMQPERVTFEQGYEQLKTIVSELDKPDISVHDMFEGFRRGKGLEKALREYLEQREGELTDIADGKNVPEYEIVAPMRPVASPQATITDQGIDAPALPGDDGIPF